MIAPEVADLHALEPDLRSWRRELIAEALDGAIWQAQGAIRFLERAEDIAAESAIRRAAEFFRTAVAGANELRRENRQTEGRLNAAASTATEAER